MSRFAPSTSTKPDPVRTDVSPSVHPDVADAIAGEFLIGTNTDGSPVHHPVFSAGRAVLDALNTTSAGLADAERSIRSAGLTEDRATERRLRNAASAKLAAARKAAEDGLAAIGQHREQVEAEIVGALGIPPVRTSLTDAGRASDVRAFLRSLPSATARAEAIRSAISEGDTDVAAAVLAASPMASGISRRDVEHVRAEAERKFAPRLSALRGSIDKLRTSVERAASITEARFGPLVGVGDTRAAAAERALAALEGGAA